MEAGATGARHEVPGHAAIELQFAGYSQQLAHGAGQLMQTWWRRGLKWDPGHRDRNMVRTSAAGRFQVPAV